MIKRPLLGWVVSLVLGILCYRLKITFIIGIGVFLSIVLFLPGHWNQIPIKLRFHKKTVNVCLFTKEDWHRYLWPVFFILGFSCMVHAKQVSPLESELTDSFEGRMYGEVSDITKKKDSVTILIKNIKVYQEDNDQWFEENAKAMIYTKQNLNLSIGDQLLIQGTILALSKATNPGQFDEYTYYKARNVVCKVFADELMIMKKNRALLSDTVYQIRCSLVEQMQALLPKEEAGLISAILFGDKTLLSDETKELYQKNGFAHIMAVSGLHISLLGYGLYQLLRKLTAPVWMATVVPVLVLIFYGALVGFTVSACRAILMFSLMMLSVFLGRWYDMSSALCGAAIVLLLKQPLQLFDPGFLLSFASVVGIAVIYPKLCEAFITSGKRGAKLKKSLLLSVSTQLLTLPLTCYFFYEFSLYSLFINLILLPLCSFLVLTSLIACVSSFLFLPLGRFIIGGSYYLLQFFSFVLHIPEKLPYHLILIGRLSVLQMTGYYLTLVASYLVYRMEPRRISWFGLAFLILFLQVKLPEGLNITCLDVSQGDCFVITANDQVVMIDGGSQDVKSVYENRIHPYFKSKGIRHIDTIFVTHADTDHISGILECLCDGGTGLLSPCDTGTGLVSPCNEGTGLNSPAMKDYNGHMSIGRIVIPKLSTYDEAYQKLILLAKQKQVSVVTMGAGEECKVGELTFRALHPSPGYPVNDRNSTSLVLWAKYGEFDGLFLGDIDRLVEEDIVQTYYPELIGESFEFLKVAHHGSKLSSSEKMLQAIKPELAVISVGKANRFGHPHKEAVKRLRESGCKLLTTSERGAIELQYQ